MEASTVREVLHQLSLLIDQGADYFELLNLPKDADTNQVRKAYFSLVKLVHPDVVRRLGDQKLLEEAQRIFPHITKAFETLSNSESLKKYRQSITKRRPSNSFKAVDPKEAARLAFQKGKLFLDRRVYKQAREALEEAVRLDKDNSRYNLYLGFAYFYDPDISDELRNKKAKELFQKALSLDPENPEAHYAMALFYKSMGEYALEYNELNDALMLDPDYLDAKRELRLLAMRWKKRKSDSFGSELKDLLYKIKNFFSKKK